MAAYGIRGPRSDRQLLKRKDRRKSFEELEARLLLFAASAIEWTSIGELCLTASYEEHAHFGDHDHFDDHHLLSRDDFGGFHGDHGFEVTGVLERDTTASDIAGSALASLELASAILPALHSNAAAAVKIYLDFDGHFESVWGGYSNVSTPTFDTNGDSSLFSSAEIAQIREVWERVSEDYAPFNVDVTTVDPGDFSNGKAIRVSIGGNGSWIGNYGGVAYIDSFTNSISNTVYVFSSNLANHAKYIAEAVSHEVGHALGLHHQSEYNASGTKLADYYAGTGTWAPIMGVGYYREQTTWHNGPNSYGPQSYQDDLAVIARTANGFGYRQDDYGNSLTTATPVNFANGQLSVSGIIEHMSDWDVMSFRLDSATSVTLDVDVAERGPNLDLRIDLYNSAGQLVLASNPSDRFDISVSAQLATDDYRLVVRGGGDYGEMGQYKVLMQVVNSAPNLQPLADVAMSHGATPRVIYLAATDADGDSVSFSADITYTNPIEQLAYNLDQQHGFLVATSDYYNQRGMQEKYLQGSSGQWFYVLPTGELFQWGGTVAASTRIATLDASYHSNLAKLYNAQTPTTSPFAGTWNVANNVLTIDPTNGVTGTYNVRVTATDGYATDTEKFTLQVVNTAPALAAIADQSILASQDQLTVQLTVSDADGDALTIAAQAVTKDPVGTLASQLKEQYGFFASSSDYYNQRGLQEKYFEGTGGNWFFMLPDGATYLWAGSVAASPLLGRLDNTYFADLTKLFQAQSINQSLGNVSLTLSGQTLTVNPADGYSGEFVVQVTVSDGAATTTRSFNVEVTNHTPSISAIADQTMTASQDTLTVQLAANDQDGDAIEFSAEAKGGDPVALLAYQLKQQHGFIYAGSDYYNQRGMQEKYFQGNGGNWYYMLPTGAVYAWGGSVASSTLLGTLGATYFQDLNRLFNAPVVNDSLDDVTLQVVGNSLIINPDAGFTGDFEIVVRATDGVATTSDVFKVSVVNRAPTITSIANQSMATSQDKLVVTLAATDLDGDAIQFSAVAKGGDPIALLAYQLKQQHGFVWSGSEYYNQRGMQEKYFQGNGGNWYYMLPTGAVYSWGGSVESSTLLGTLNGTYHATLANLFNAPPVNTSISGVTLTVVQNTLTIDPDANFSGTFEVQVSASDGVTTSTTSFALSVVNRAPTITAIADQTMGLSQDTLTVQLGATDADGDSIQFSAVAKGGDPIDRLAYQLDQTHNLYYSGSYYTNQRGLQEKYFQGNGGNWYYMLPGGEVYSWGGTVSASTLLGTLNGSYYNDPNRLFNAQRADTPISDVTLSIVAGTLTIDPNPGFSGEFEIEVSATDGNATTTTTFTVSVLNRAPTIQPVQNVGMTPSTDTVTVNLAGADADGDALTWTAQVVSADSAAVLAYQLKQQHGFYSGSSDYYNQRGLQEKYFQGNGGNWYFMFSDGSLYAWAGSIAASPKLGTLDATYFADLNKLFNAQPASNPSNQVTLTLSGTQLTIDPANGYTGRFQVRVSASDGFATTTTFIDVAVENQPPTLGPIADQTMTSAEDFRQITITTADADGDPITLTAGVVATDVTGASAYQLKQQYGLRWAGSDYFNQRGLQEKYFLGNNDTWYFMFPDGSVYAWAGSIAASPLLGRLDSSYFVDLTKLFNAPAIENPADHVSVQVQGNVLTVNPAQGYSGNFRVQVNATAGAYTTSRTFAVNVGGAAPPAGAMIASATTIAILGVDGTDSLTIQSIAGKISGGAPSYDLALATLWRAPNSTDINRSIFPQWTHSTRRAAIDASLGSWEKDAAYGAVSDRSAPRYVSVLRGPARAMVPIESQQATPQEIDEQPGPDDQFEFAEERALSLANVNWDGSSQRAVDEIFDAIERALELITD